MSGEQNWRTPTGSTQAETYLGNQQKKNEVADRRPVIRKAGDLVGPGIDATAVSITNFNDPLATYNGYYAADINMTNAPNPFEQFVGTTVMDAEMGGVQRFTGLTSKTDYKRVFIRNPSDAESIIWGAWQSESGIVAVASVMAYAGPVAPYGWLICDGSSYSALIYPTLFSVIGTTFGGTGGSFNVPDLRDRTIYGVGSNWSLGETDGLAVASRTMDLWHLHNVATANAGDHNHSAISSVAGSHNHGGQTGTPDSTVNRTFDDANAVAHPTHRHNIPDGGGHDHPINVAYNGEHAHSGVTFDIGEIAGTRLRGVGLNYIIRHAELV